MNFLLNHNDVSSGMEEQKMRRLRKMKNKAGDFFHFGDMLCAGKVFKTHRKISLEVNKCYRR